MSSFRYVLSCSLLAAFALFVMSCGQSTTEQAPTQSAQPMSFFVTSVGLGDGGNLGGLPGADKHCQALATAVGAGNRSWRAYLATHSLPPEKGAAERGGPRGAVRAASEGPSGAIPRLRIGMGPWYNAKGQLVAQNVYDLQGDTPGGNNLSKETALNEKGQEIPASQHEILTGAKPDGSIYSLSQNMTCGNWTSNSSGHAQVGISDRSKGGNTSWNSESTTSGCSQADLVSSGGAGLYYCFATN